MKFILKNNYCKSCCDKIVKKKLHKFSYELK